MKDPRLTRGLELGRTNPWLMLKNHVGRRCAWCGHEYTSIGNIKARAPRFGRHGDLVDGHCWDAYDQVIGRPNG